MTKKQRPIKPLAPPPFVEWRYGSYKCPELGQTCPRPGAYDAFKLPSLMQGQRVYPKENK